VIDASMKVQYRITEDDYAAAARLHAWRDFTTRPSTTNLFPLFTILVVLGVGLWTGSTATVPALFLAIVAISIVCACTLFLYVPSRARWHYRRYKSMQEPITAELTEEGIRFSNSDSEGLVRWSKVLRWLQNDRFIMIYTMPILFYLVPKSIAREGFDIPMLIRRLAEQVGPER